MSLKAGTLGRSRHRVRLESERALADSSVEIRYGFDARSVG